MPKKTDSPGISFMAAESVGGASQNALGSTHKGMRGEESQFWRECSRILEKQRRKKRRNDRASQTMTLSPRRESPPPQLRSRGKLARLSSGCQAKAGARPSGIQPRRDKDTYPRLGHEGFAARPPSSYKYAQILIRRYQQPCALS